MKTLIIYKSIHLGSTRLIANTIGVEMKADVIEPKEFKPSVFNTYDIIGFGSGIYDGGFHKAIHKFIVKQPTLKGKRVFLFSTAGVIYDKSHKEIRELLIEKNADIVDEFYCKGFNKNSFLKYIGGMNKGRPNAVDIEKAQRFARNILS